MEIVSFDVPRQQSERHPLVVAPLGDLQWSGDRGSTAKDVLRRHIDRCLEKDGYFLGMGDACDFLSPSNRQRLRAAALYDVAEDVIEDKAVELVHELYEKFLKPTRGRWIAFLSGHHYANLRSGETTDQRLCQLLDAPFVGTSVFVRLNFRIGTKGDTRGASYPIVLFAHHGCGSSIKAYGPLTKLENLAPYFDADILCIGHQSKQAASLINRITPRWHTRGGPDLIHRRITLIGTGSFARGYVPGAKQGNVPMGGYVEQRLLNPAALGAPIVYISPNRHDRWEDGKRHKEWSFEVRVEL